MITFNHINRFKHEINRLADHIIDPDTKETRFILNKANVFLLDEFMETYKTDIHFYIDNDNEDFSFVNLFDSDPLEDIIFFLERDQKNKRILLTFKN